MEPASMSNLPAELTTYIVDVDPRNVGVLSRVNATQYNETGKQYLDLCNSEPIRASEVRKFLDRAVGCGNNEFLIFFSHQLVYGHAHYNKISTKFVVNKVRRTRPLDSMALEVLEGSYVIVSPVISEINAADIDRALALRINSVDLQVLNIDLHDFGSGFRSYTKVGSTLQDNSYNQIHMKLDGDHVYQRTQPKPNDYQPTIGDASAAELDFGSQYYIFGQRLGCVKRDPNYARKRIIGIINTVVAKIETADPFTIFSIYARLFHELLLQYPSSAVVQFDYIMSRAGVMLTPNAQPNLLENIKNVIRQSGQMLVSYYSTI